MPYQKDLSPNQLRIYKGHITSDKLRPGCLYIHQDICENTRDDDPIWFVTQNHDRYSQQKVVPIFIKNTYNSNQSNVTVKLNKLVKRDGHLAGLGELVDYLETAQKFDGGKDVQADSN